jgi:hypothetical protein
MTANEAEGFAFFRWHSLTRTEGEGCFDWIMQGDHTVLVHACLGEWQRLQRKSQTPQELPPC